MEGDVGEGAEEVETVGCIYGALRQDTLRWRKVRRENVTNRLKA